MVVYFFIFYSNHFIIDIQIIITSCIVMTIVAIRTVAIMHITITISTNVTMTDLMIIKN